jgi:hypothetical protein
MWMPRPTNHEQAEQITHILLGRFKLIMPCLQEGAKEKIDEIALLLTGEMAA